MSPLRQAMQKIARCGYQLQGLSTEQSGRLVFSRGPLASSCCGYKNFSQGNPSGSGPSEMERAAYNLLYIQIEVQEERQKLAALFLQVTEGPNKTPEPKNGSSSDIACWKAWKQLGDMPKNEAEKKYLIEATRILQGKGLTMGN